jgi:hypothetical protein
VEENGFNWAKVLGRLNAPRSGDLPLVPMTLNLGHIQGNTRTTKVYYWINVDLVLVDGIYYHMDQWTHQHTKKHKFEQRIIPHDCAHL